MTTLMCAIVHRHQNIVKFIVDCLNEYKTNNMNGTQIVDDYVNTGRNKNGYTAYFLACDIGDWQMVKYLIRELKINVKKCYLKEFSCIGYKFCGSEAAKAKGHELLAMCSRRKSRTTTRTCVSKIL